MSDRLLIDEELCPCIAETEALIRQDRKTARLVAEEIFEQLEQHENCDKWGNPVLAIGYNDKGRDKYFEWWQALKEKWLK